VVEIQSRKGDQVKAVILAGGFGTRLSEETHDTPKPMVQIGGQPILWHIMKMYSAAGITDFVVCLGYKGYVIKEYFANYFLHSADVTIDLATNDLTYHHSTSEPWKVTLVETGLSSMTGGRLRRVRPYLDDETFCLTYGDGVADVDIQGGIDFHREKGLKATVTGVVQPGRFGALDIVDQKVGSFIEKPNIGAFINGGFFVLEPEVLDLIEDDSTVWEKEPLEHLSASGQLACYLHDGFWQCMDTLRDKRQLESMWEESRAPWKVWD
jgi:glucose-1-phosphate cytidylyltransferase